LEKFLSPTSRVVTILDGILSKLVRVRTNQIQRQAQTADRTWASFI